MKCWLQDSNMWHQFLGRKSTPCMSNLPAGYHFGKSNVTCDSQMSHTINLQPILNLNNAANIIWSIFTKAPAFTPSESHILQYWKDLPVILLVADWLVQHVGCNKLMSVVPTPCSSNGIYNCSKGMTSTVPYHFVQKEIGSQVSSLWDFDPGDRQCPFFHVGPVHIPYSWSLRAAPRIYCE